MLTEREWVKWGKIGFFGVIFMLASWGTASATHQQIAAAEYFINTDPGKGMGKSITAKDGNYDGTEELAEIDVALNGLSNGRHIAYVRFQDNSGTWGPSRGIPFMVQADEGPALTIQGAEYFIDTDPGEGMGQPIGAPVDGAFDEQIEELEADVNLANLSTGRHYVYFRVQASNGRWGLPRGIPFQVENIAYIDRAEYFFNTDPGEGSGTAIPAPEDGNFNGQEEDVDLDIDIASTGLAEGKHTLYLRFRNSHGEWSQPSSQAITIQTKPVIVVSEDTLSFGEHVVGDEITQTFTIKNDGDGALNITDITSSSSEFTVDATTGSIPANSDDELTFTVTFNPSTAGSKEATLTIANNDQAQTIRLLGSALAKEPIVELSTPAIDYGTVVVGDSVSKYVAIYNTGYDTLRLTSISVDSDEFRVSPTSGSLLPQSSLVDSLVVNVALVPESEGNKTATLTLAGNITSKEIALSGSAELNPEPTISLSTDSLAFSAVEIGKDSIRTLQVRNLGTNTLTISSFEITGDGFSASLSTPVDIERGSPLDIPVTFSPATISSFSGAIQIESNDAENGSVNIALSGEGTDGPPTKILSVLPEELDFGQVTNGESSSQTITLLNEGNATLKISGVRPNTTEFVVQGGPTSEDPLFLAPDSSSNIEVTFTPTEGGEKSFSGDVAIISDRTDFVPALLIPVKGIGVDQPTPNVQLSTRSLNFGELRIGQSKTVSFSITNSGNAVLNVSDVTISGSGFAIATPTSLSFSLQGGQQQAFEITFSPTEVDSYSGTLTVESNIDPADIELLGEGVTLSAGIDSTELREEDISISFGQDVPITIQPTGLGSSGSAHLYYKAGGGGGVSSYNKVAMLGSANGTYAFSIPANVSSEAGISYWFEVSDGTETVTSPASNPSVKPYSIRVDIPEGIAKSSPQPAGTDQNYYRMISIPLTETSGAVDTVLSNFGPSGDPGEEVWRLFRWQSGKYVEHNEGGFESFAPGRAYWFITTSAASIKSGAGTSARTDEPFSIFLQPGWNMIGSPFTYPVSWGESDTPEGIENLWHYDGSGFTNSSRMEPWQGYFVENTTNNPVEIKLSPVEAGSGNAKNNPLANAGIDPESGWAIQVRAESGLVRDDINIAGVQSASLDEKDQTDLGDAPKQPGEFLQVAFLQDEERLSVDLRAPNTEGQYWDFGVQTNSSAPTVNLDLSTIGELPSGFEIRLIDKDQKAVWNLNDPKNRLRDIRTALGDTLERSFRLVVGTEAFINQNNMGITELPQNFVLKQNYPNPFNPSTTIAFGLPERADVTLEIYNSIGRKVATLIDQQMNAGYHDLIWDASAVASGMYFYRIKARTQDSKSSYSKIQKMMLIK